MSTKTLVSLTDDIDGTEATETILFALDKTEYEIDLNEKHAEKLRAALARFVPHARTPSSKTASKTKSKTASRPARAAVGVANGRPVATVNAADIRVWAKATGIKCPAKGRIPAEVADQYHAATH